MLTTRGHDVRLYPRNPIALWFRLLSKKNRPDVLLWQGTGREALLGAFADFLFRIPGLWWPAGRTDEIGPPPRTARRSEVYAASRARRVLVANDAEREQRISRIAARDEFRAERLIPLIEVISHTGDLPGDEETVLRLETVLQEAARWAPRVWLVSPAPWTRGGVAEVARQVLVSPLNRDWRMVSVPTYANGSVVSRLWWAIRGLLTSTFGLVFRKPDLVHIKVASRGSFARKLSVTALCRMRGVPVLIHIHGGGFDEFVRQAPGSVRAAAGWMIEGAPLTLALSERWADKLRPLFPAARIEAAPNPVETQKYRGIAEERLGSRDSKMQNGLPRALFLGDLVDRKGVFDLIESWSLVKQDLPESQLVLAGDGNRVLLEDACRKAGVSSLVRFPGWVGPAEKRELLAQADVFVLPSYAEGVPIALLEAMAAGLPSVVTPVGGVLDAVTPSVEAIVVEPGDIQALAGAIVSLLNEPEQASRIGEAALRRARDLDIENYARVLDRAYQVSLGMEQE
jgi:glycosyltransferase involved in cell wall biosynthesis